MLVYLVCASVLSILCHFILIKIYVSLTYVCPLGDVILCSIRTLLQYIGCSCVSTNGYTHLSCWFKFWGFSFIPDFKPSLVLLLYTYLFMTLIEYWFFCIHVLCFVVVAFSACLQMAPSSPKKKTPTKKADKRMKMDHNLFRSVSHFERYKNFFLKPGKVCGFGGFKRHLYP